MNNTSRRPPQSVLPPLLLPPLLSPPPSHILPPLPHPILPPCPLPPSTFKSHTPQTPPLIPSRTRTQNKQPNPSKNQSASTRRKWRGRQRGRRVRYRARRMRWPGRWRGRRRRRRGRLRGGCRGRWETGGNWGGWGLGEGGGRGGSEGGWGWQSIWYWRKWWRGREDLEESVWIMWWRKVEVSVWKVLCNPSPLRRSVNTRQCNCAHWSSHVLYILSDNYCGSPPLVQTLRSPFLTREKSRFDVNVVLLLEALSFPFMISEAHYSDSIWLRCRLVPSLSESVRIKAIVVSIQTPPSIPCAWLRGGVLSSIHPTFPYNPPPLLHQTQKTHHNPIPGTFPTSASAKIRIMMQPSITQPHPLFLALPSHHHRTSPKSVTRLYHTYHQPPLPHRSTPSTTLTPRDKLNPRHQWPP